MARPAHQCPPRGLRTQGSLFSRQNSQGPRQPTRAPHSEKPSRPGGHERSTEGCVQTPHWGLRPGRGRCRQAGRPRCRGTAQGQRTWVGRAAETSGLAHPPSAPAAGEKVKTVHSQARGIYTQRRGGGGAWGFPSTSHVQGRHPPPAPSSYFGSGEDAVAGPCLSCDRHTGHSEGKTENLGAEGVQGSGAVGVTQIPCACGRACCHPPQA